MRERNDSRYVEDTGVAFTIYCDEAGLTLAEGFLLAGEIGEQLEFYADDRRAYLPDAESDVDDGTA